MSKSASKTNQVPTPKADTEASQGSQLSETQEAIVQPAGNPDSSEATPNPEANGVEATQHALFVEEVSAIFNSEDEAETRSGDMDYVADLVNEGKLTPEDFQAITTVAFEDYQGDTEAPSERSFQAIKTDLEEQVAAGTMPKGDILRLHIQGLVNAARITEEQGQALFQTFGINEPLDTIGKEILSHYQETYHSIDECREAGKEIYAELVGIKAESDTNKFSQLVNVLADFAVLQYREGRLPWSNTVDESLWARVMEYKVFGEATVETEENETLGENTVVIARHDPYRDPVILQYRKTATRAACLLAYGSVTQVHFGTIEKAKVPNGRVSRRLVFTTGTEGYDPATMFRAVCIPANVLVPNVYKYIRPKVVIEGREVDQWTAVPEAKNEDTSSRYLSSEFIDPLFNRYFKGDELVYDLTSTTTMVPSGAIKGSKRPGMPDNVAPEKTTRQTRGTQAEGKQVSELEARIKELEADRTAALNQNKADIVAGLNAVAALIRDERQEFPREARIAAYNAVHAMIRHRVGNTMPDDDEAKAAIRLYMDLEAHISWEEEKGAWIWQSADGAVRREFQLNGAKAA